MDTVINSNLNVISILEVSKEALNKNNAKIHLHSMKFKSKLTMKLEKKPPKGLIVSSRTQVGKDQRNNHVR